MTSPEADIAVIGGSGFYALVDDTETVAVDTPYGPPSGPVHLTELDGRTVAFIARHGADHELPPHRVRYRANIWALHELGVTRILGPCASGSLQAEIEPGHFVVCDQLADRTTSRPTTYFDGPTTNHIAFADPYCPELRAVALAAAADHEVTVHDGGTVVVIEGPRFATRAESQSYQAAGWSVINMTQAPEAALARELGICYASIALVTDYDAGLDGDPNVAAVTMDDVFSVMAENNDRARALLLDAIRRVQPERGCGCADAPNGLTPDLPSS